MSKEHILFRVIDSTCYSCIDTGCSDFDRAEYNRYIVANRLFTIAYQMVENAVRGTPPGKRLPSWIPRGELPQVGKQDWEQYGGGQRGEFELLERVVVDLTVDTEVVV